jgi:hypothetical protein
MARDAALVSTWGPPISGREGKSLEVFMEFVQFIGKHAAEGRCQPAEVYFAVDGSGGMAVVRGKTDALAEISESEENEKLLAKGQMIVEDLKTHWYYTGDEEMQRGTRIFAEAAGEMGYM